MPVERYVCIYNTELCRGKICPLNAKEAGVREVA